MGMVLSPKRVKAKCWRYEILKEVRWKESDWGLSRSVLVVSGALGFERFRNQRRGASQEEGWKYIPVGELLMMAAQTRGWGNSKGRSPKAIDPIVITAVITQILIHLKHQ